MHETAKYCSPAKRVREGFLWLRKCRKEGKHLHQKCPHCGFKWICKTAEEI